MTDRERIQDPKTTEELVDQLNGLLWNAQLRHVDSVEAGKLVKKFGEPNARNDLVLDPSTGNLAAILRDDERRIHCGLTIELPNPAPESTVRFARKLVETFIDDVRAAPWVGKSGELWVSLQATRFSRSVAKFSSFHTALFTRWLLAFESASQLRYEGQRFSGRMILTKQKKWITENRNLSFIPFSQNIPLTEALLSQKWTRSLATSKDAFLVGYGHDKGVFGFATVKDSSRFLKKRIPPHEDLLVWCSSILPGTIGFLVSPLGDLYLILPDGTWFVKSQGVWRIASYFALRDVASQFLAGDLLDAVIAIARDLSFEGKGALLCVLDDPSSINELVPDHGVEKRANAVLRSCCKNFNLRDPHHIRLIKSLASIDGTVIFDKQGNVLDVACMVGDPSQGRLKGLNIAKLTRFEGARETAAWNASLLGTAIKVSEDGPISVFRNGSKLYASG